MSWVRKSKCYVIFGIIMLGITSCSRQNATFQGYFEGEYLYMAPSVPGHLDKLMVSRGQVVNANAQLFVVEQTDELALFKQSQAQLHNTQATLKDMQLGRRKPELDVIRAQIKQAFSAKELANINLVRDKKQFTIGAISKSQLDASITNYNVAVDRLNELNNDLLTAKLPSRDDQIKAQMAQIRFANAGLKDAEWRLSQTINLAPESALVYDTLYNVGEWVSAGNPVVILLPPTKLKIRFFVPEEEVGKIRLGEDLVINCDGCNKNIKARITYIADLAEYTPPVIYSNETRNKLVFRVEAKPTLPDLLSMHPGQPVEVMVGAK